ncbi:DUF6083 domain-containing protein [Peterkaempfera bronchialis]|uniref:Uncharacterized protein n=1 Tax=Peterkaempfera bronchialis TaxID=2126346 RepID=A0A345SWZ7_9ACTN|nr:DUF6083 domain-containing protein [Peterkaempfera bronchialis]AXI78252.1 hypothetical protein C7M71_013180 [Peterkaempfera bronchialis]
MSVAPWDEPDRQDPLSALARPRYLRIHQSSASKTLRSNDVDTCRYCGNLIEWFDRWNAARIPLTPMEFPSRAVPPRYAWNVSNGVAHGGSGGEFCRIPHPAICPALDHDDLDPVLQPLVKALAVRMRTAIAHGTFTPAVPEEPAQAEPRAESAAVRPARHVLMYMGILYLAPGPIDEVRCVAYYDTLGDRCSNPVLEPEAREGSWTQTPIPSVPGRLGRSAAFNGTMWVFELSVPDYHSALRWLRQRCSLHHPSGPDHDAVAPEWAEFQPGTHHAHILRQRPADADIHAPALPNLLRHTAAARPSTTCAGQGCANASLAPVGPGWLCYQCTAKLKRRQQAERRRQRLSSPNRSPLDQRSQPARDGNTPSV